MRPSAGEKEENVQQEISSAGTTSGAALGGANQKSKNATSEQDLDVFLLGDTGDSDEGPGKDLKVDAHAALSPFPLCWILPTPHPPGQANVTFLLILPSCGTLMVFSVLLDDGDDGFDDDFDSI